MRVAIIAGSGGIGRWLLAIAREDGNHVKTLVRDRRKLPGDLGAIGVVEGDVRDARAVETVIGGSDVVLSALGSDSSGAADTREIGTLNILSAMKDRGVTRLHAVSCPSVEDDSKKNTLVGRFLKPFAATSPAEDCRNMERAIVASGMVWSIVRPGRLTDGPRTGLYRANERFLPEGGRDISRADVADFMVRTIVDERTIKKIAALAY